MLVDVDDDDDDDETSHLSCLTLTIKSAVASVTSGLIPEVVMYTNDVFACGVLHVSFDLYYNKFIKMMMMIFLIYF